MPDAPRPAARPSGPPSFVLSTEVNAPVARVLQAFFSHTDLSYWWDAERSVAVARASGPYAVTWPASELRDPLLGQLGGTLHGTIMDCGDRGFFVADVHWQPPDGEPLGPMALEVSCQPAAPERTTVTVRQTASEDGERWQRYFTLTRAGLDEALATLKDYIENEWLYKVKTIKQGRP
ncbi:MAG: hypothetical protein R2745_11370 [Vicinamibacterales bacterium]